MQKIGGKIFFIMAMLMSIAASSFAVEPISIQVKDLEGTVIDSVPVGQLFEVTVTIVDTALRDTVPKITTTPHIDLRWAGKRIERINKNQMAIAYQFRGYAQKEGVYKIGPATVIHQTGTLSSATTILHVTEPESTNLQKKTAQTAAFVVVENGNKSPYVGQRVPISLTFYYTDSSMRIVNILHEGSDAMVLKDREREERGVQTVNGRSYNFIRWNFYLTPQKSGNTILAPFCVEYQVSEKSAGHIGFGFFNMAQYVTRRAYTTALALDVQQLPPYQTSDPLLGIGSFSAVKITLDSPTVVQGRALLLSLDIVADADLDDLVAPVLTSLPEGLRSYDSKAVTIENANSDKSETAKRFEYVLQGLKPGSWNIPRQQFTVFDVVERKYKKIYTNSLSITIVPSQAESVENSSVLLQSQGGQVPLENSTFENEDAQFELIEHGPWSKHAARSPIPIWLFLLLLIVPIMVLCGIRIGSRGIFFVMQYKAHQRKYTVFARSLAAMRRAEKDGKKTELYYIFLQLFADKYHVNTSQIDPRFMHIKLQEAGCSEYMIAEWNKFFIEISSQVFSSMPVHTSQNLFMQARNWIELLEKYL